MDLGTDYCYLYVFYKIISRTSAVTALYCYIRGCLISLCLLLTGRVSILPTRHGTNPVALCPHGNLVLGHMLLINIFKYIVRQRCTVLFSVVPAYKEL